MDRAKRVQRLKRIIIIGFVTAILIPIVLCIILYVRVLNLEARIEELLAQKQEVYSAQEYVQVISLLNENMMKQKQRSVEILQADILEAEALAQEAAAAKEAEPNLKIYLTFDDGPSSYTSEILDILKEYGIHATFFVVGKEDEHSLAMYRRIVAEGHTLGMHSYSHKYQEIYESEEAFEQDLQKLSDLLYRTTGVRSTVYRFPGGSSNRVSSVDMEALFAYLAKQGIHYYDWNISSKDATTAKLSTESIVNNCIGELDGYHNAMILMHDAADKHTTVEALPIIIERCLKMEDTVFLPITEETKLIQHKN